MTHPVTSPTVTARLATDQGELRLPESLPPNVARLDVVEINSRTAKRAEASGGGKTPPVLPAPLDLQIAVPGRVFVRGRGLGPQFEGDLFVGASRTTLLNGFLFRFRLTADRQHFSFSDPRLADRVADNVDKFDQTESESLIVGRDFGITTDIQSGPNGNVFVVSLSNGAVYEIKSKPSLLFTATLTVGFQSLRAALSNPVDALRTE